MSRLRILVLAPEANPEATSAPLVGYSHAEALARIHDVTLVVRANNSKAVRSKGASFRAIQAISMPWLDKLFAWSFRRIFRNNFHSQALTVFTYPFSVAFEWHAWQQMKRRISAAEFDLVLRLMPITAVLPSAMAFFLRNGPIPFVIGPLNGGLPWPEGFSQVAEQKEWISSLRNVYRFLPFARSTYRDAAAIMVASSHTYAEFIQYREKLFFVPENAVNQSVCSDVPRTSEHGSKLELIFVGGLVPCKACDLALRAASPLLRNDLAHFSILGDGPERSRLEELARSLGIEKAVSFHGWVSHEEALSRMRSADVLVFPSIREFGGGVVFEALASGAIPVVADFGGPGDIVYPETGYKVSLTNESDMVAQMEKILNELAGNRELLLRLRRQGMAFARERLTWDAKAQTTTQVLQWALARGPKPDLLPPKLPVPGIDSPGQKRQALHQTSASG
jgi:glycosyltransferase involved in cell wall biosynthesis